MKTCNSHKRYLELNLTSTGKKKLDPYLTESANVWNFNIM